MINVELILATKRYFINNNGLITILAKLPSYVWTEVLTHKRLVRNSSSARAQKTDRHLSDGYYKPKIFYQDQKGMQSSDLPIENQKRAFEIYDEVWEFCQNKSKELELLNVTKEQRNRIIPPIKIVTSVITGTENAWHNFLELRNHPSADKAMQDLASKIKYIIDNIVWIYNDMHLPFITERDYSFISYNRDLIYKSAARLARVSYDTPKEGRQDLSLAKDLLKMKHYSPFEHIAFWGVNPKKSAICSKNEDLHNNEGWTNYRSLIEGI